MKAIKLFAASVAVLGAMIAAPAAHAHATYNNGGTGAAPSWTNGAPAEWLASTSTLPSIGYLGIHSLTNARVIQTGVYDSAANAANNSAALGGAFAGITSKQSDSLLGQTYNYNIKPANAATQLSSAASVSVGANSWANGVANGIDAANTGLSFGNIHASSGSSGNLELNAMNLPSNAFHYVNVTVGDDATDSTVGQLAFSVYQGWSTGPGLSGLHLLATVLADTAGQNIGLTIALTGNEITAGSAGEYTIVVGDQSSVGGKYKIGLQAANSALYSNVVAAVPVPGAVWLFGSALAGFIGLGRRKAIAA